MLVGNQTRVVTVVAGKIGVGCTSTTLNLATALARSGKDVLVLDENPAPCNLPERMMLPVRHDLLDVSKEKCTLQQALLHTQGFAVLPVARAMAALPHLQESEQHKLEHALGEASIGVDVLLVDAALRAGICAPSSSLASCVTLLVVVDGTVSGITESYALIKQLALENARLHFEIVVNKVTDEQAARTVFDNMARVARHHLAARLEYFGHIPLDNKLNRANRLGRPVVEAFPASVSAQAYWRLAQRLPLLPVEQDDSEASIPLMVQSLMRQMRNGLHQLAG